MLFRKALLIVAILATTASYSLAGEHPCLLFSSSDIDFIRERIQSDTTAQLAWDELLNHQGAHYLDKCPVSYRQEGYTNARHEYNALAKLGFLHLIVEDPVMADSFGNRAIECCQRYFEKELDADNELSVATLTSSFSLCYDYCYDLMSDSLRQAFRDTIKREMDLLVSKWWPRIYGYWPNTLAQHNGALGLAAIVLDGEVVQGEIYDGEAMWDTSRAMINRYLQELYGSDGAGVEGCLYSSFGLSGMVPFMEALRRKTEGTEDEIDMFQENEEILRRIYDWLAYEVLPWKHQYSNLNDSHLSDFIRRYSEYIDGHWGYSLCWGPLVGIYNDPIHKWTFENLIKWGDINRRTGECGSLPLIILKYNDDLASEDPVDRLPLSKHFEGRGLVYFRTGWEGPEDIMFSLECGPAINTETGHYSVRHHHCDKNSFTLYAYGERFAIDSGKLYQSPIDHNVIFIDDRGQMCHGEPWYSSGVVEGQISGEFCDYVHGDATDAYNRMWVIPSPGTSGEAYDTTEGNNPVLNADRIVTFVRDDRLPPYFVVADDINKDNTVHEYQWLLHTQCWIESGDPIVLHGSTNDMNIYVVSPSDYSATQEMYTPEFTPSPLFGDTLPPDTTKLTHPLLTIECDAVNPYYQIVLFPHKAEMEVPTVTDAPISNGRCAKVAWSTATDYNILKTTGVISEDWVSTDAKISLIREDLDSVVSRFMMAEGTNLWMRDVLLVDTYRDTGSVINSGVKVVIHSKNPNQFKVYAPEATQLMVNDTSVTFYRIGDYIYYPGIAGLIAEDATLSGMLQVSGDVTLDSGVTLTLQPAAEVRFTAGADNLGSGVDTSLCELIVEGNLNAQGGDSQPIILTSTSSTEGDWWGIRFKQGSSGLIKNALVEYGYCGVLADSGSKVTVDSCTIQDNEVYGIRCDHTNSVTTISRNWIKDNGVYGIWAEHCSPGILDNLINGSRYGIKASYAGFDMLIKGNSIDNASIYPKGEPPYETYVGISLQSSSPIVLDNEISGGLGLSGLSCASGSHPEIKSCIIGAHCKKGLSCYDGSSPTIDSTQVKAYTERGVYCYQSSYPRLGDTGIEGSGGNSIYSPEAYCEVWCEETLHPVMAESCWWGTAFPDSSRFRGEVDYLPCLDHDPFGEVGVEDDPEKGLPTEFALSQNYPNPFNPTTAISYQLPGVKPHHTTLQIYNILGQVVRTLVDEEQVSGYYSVRWDGRDGLGKGVSSGVYFCRLKAGEFVKTRKMVVLR
jgi:hypothetical protein